MSLYSLRNIFQKYNGRPALSVPSLDIEAGSIIGIVGPNGAGKSTLMRMLAFLEKPLSGSIVFDGRDTSGDVSELRRQVTLLTQEPYLLRRSVYDNVAYGLKVRGTTDCDTIVSSALESVGLDPDVFMQRAWFELSGGEGQRVALAARLALSPRVLLMDEPTASLDEDSAYKIRQAALASRSEKGTTLVIVSHDKEWITSVADRLVTIRHGEISG